MSYVVERLCEAGYHNIEVHPTRSTGDAARTARAARADGCDLVLAVGGDGTASEVVNGLTEFNVRAEQPSPKQPILGFIPSGTSNDFASALRIPGDVRKALQIITKGHCAQVDIGCINARRSFNYIVAAGAFTRLTYTTPHRLKRILGVWAYLKDILREFPLITKPFRLRLSVDGQEVSGKYVIALIINSPNFAGMRKVIPKACMDDGVFDILLLPKSSPKVFWSAIRSMALGVDESILDAGILHLQGRRITICSEKELDWNIDGELGGKGVIKSLFADEAPAANGRDGERPDHHTKEMLIEARRKSLSVMVPALAMRKVLFHQYLPLQARQPGQAGQVKQSTGQEATPPWGKARKPIQKRILSLGGIRRTEEHTLQ